jgi:2-polyprenyl-3-methyl-5-hydroxy-6-metoxy-1,4-benzoquinol methylase
MVLEHVAHPAAFWARVYDILAPGGVFVAFSVNGAHWGAPVTRLLGTTRLKSAYLTLLRGKPGADRVADYPVYYRTNTPAQIRRVARDFRSVTTLTCGTVGDVASYAPRRLRPMVRAFDKLAHRITGQPSNIIVRAER